MHLLHSWCSTSLAARSIVRPVHCICRDSEQKLPGCTGKRRWVPASMESPAFASICLSLFSVSLTPALCMEGGFSLKGRLLPQTFAGNTGTTRHVFPKAVHLPNGSQERLSLPFFSRGFPLSNAMAVFPVFGDYSLTPLKRVANSVCWSFSWNFYGSSRYYCAQSFAGYTKCYAPCPDACRQTGAFEPGLGRVRLGSAVICLPICERRLLFRRDGAEPKADGHEFR